jgi:hypothetical protein
MPSFSKKSTLRLDGIRPGKRLSTAAGQISGVYDSQRLRTAVEQFDSQRLRTAVEQWDNSARVAKVGLIGIRFSVNFSRVAKIGQSKNDLPSLAATKNSTKGFGQALSVRA